MSLFANLKKAAGLFVEITPTVDDDAALADPLADTPPPPPETKTVETLVQEAPGPALHEVTVPPAASSAALSNDGQVNFPALYQAAGLPTTPITAEQMRDTIAGLPGTDREVKRQTVKVIIANMGKTLGASPETIVTDASRKLAVLHKYTEQLKSTTNAAAQAAQQQIAALKKEIAEKEQIVAAAQQQVTTVTAICQQEAEHLDEVLEFFSLDVPPSKYAAGK